MIPMASILTSRVTRFRLMAEEIRTAAVGMAFHESRRTLINIADNYDLLADQLEQVVARERTKTGCG